MTRDQMIMKVNIGVQKIDSASYDNLLAEEIDNYLNRAVNQIVISAASSFESNSLAIESIRTLVVRSAALDVTEQVIEKEGVFADKATIPSDHFLPVNSLATIFYNRKGVYSVTNGANKRELFTSDMVTPAVVDVDYKASKIPLIYVQHDDIFAGLDDPFIGPRLDNSLYTIEGNSVTVYTDSRFIVDKVHLTYIRQPVIIGPGVNCDLPVTAHQNVVDVAVALIIQDLRYQPES